MKQQYDIAAFVWPSYTGDEPRTRIFWPEGYGEWQTVKAMDDKGYPGCRWPRRPLWGYVNEADSRVMEMQIDCALSYGVNTFIYDWYWYDDRPFLENCLNDGFLKARNCRQMQFYLMWANHNATHLWDKRNSDDLSTVIWRGCPVYMIFDLHNFIRNFGTTHACKAAIKRFREKTAAAGFPGLHLQFVHWRHQNYNWLPDEDEYKDASVPEIYAYLRPDSVTDYNWGGVLNFDGDYAALTDEYMTHLSQFAQNADVPYYPNLSLGWDNNVRFQKFIPGVVTGNTPERVREACEKIKVFADEKLRDGTLRAPLITVNSWNEWTETSYLQPDDLYGYGYLEAVRDVFCG